MSVIMTQVLVTNVISQSQTFLYKYADNQGQKNKKYERTYVLGLR